MPAGRPRAGRRTDLKRVRIGVNASQMNLMVNLALMGTGMGLSIPAFLIAVQSTVPGRDLGVATSTLQFSRSIGGVLGVSVMGTVPSFRLAGRLAEAGLDPATISIDSLLDPVAQATTNMVLEGTLREALAGAIQGVFVIAFIAAVLGLVATTFTPRGRIDQLVAQRTSAKSSGQRAPTSASGK